jgi:NAD-dependent DNA ligase
MQGNYLFTKYIEAEILAHRYLYYVKSTPVITDQEYDFLEKYAEKILPENSIVITKVGSDDENSYSGLVKERANHLLQIFKKKRESI